MANDDDNGSSAPFFSPLIRRQSKEEEANPNDDSPTPPTTYAPSLPQRQIDDLGGKKREISVSKGNEWLGENFCVFWENGVKKN